MELLLLLGASQSLHTRMPILQCFPRATCHLVLSLGSFSCCNFLTLEFLKRKQKTNKSFLLLLMLKVMIIVFLHLPFFVIFFFFFDLVAFSVIFWSFLCLHFVRIIIFRTFCECLFRCVMCQRTDYTYVNLWMPGMILLLQLMGLVCLASLSAKQHKKLQQESKLKCACMIGRTKSRFREERH